MLIQRFSNKILCRWLVRNLHTSAVSVSTAHDDKLLTNLAMNFEKNISTHNNNEWRNIAMEFLSRLAEFGDKNLDRKFIPMKCRKHNSSEHQLTHFVDYCQMRAIGGNGGDGMVHFLQLKYIDKGGPSGGDGGHGGHVILKATAGVKDLSHANSVVSAPSGEKGRSRNCCGANAKNVVIEVPIGTCIRLDGNLVGSLDEDGTQFLAARGGAGGKGNPYFATDIDQSPLVAEYGGEGEIIEYDLELRTMADVGLIGIPNAGKSTLLRAISRARPKVAAYPFTTVNPHVGMVQYGDHEQLAVADIPGLIKDAHKNRGLGIAFLRHVDRCRCLLYVIDMSAPDPMEQFEILRHELEQYQTGLSLRPHTIVANKMDLPEAQENFKALKHRVDLPLVPVSAKFGQDLTPLLSLLRLLVEYNQIDPLHGSNGTSEQD